MQTLRSKLIRLAHENPQLREDLLPLLTKEAMEVASLTPFSDSNKRMVSDILSGMVVGNYGLESEEEAKQYKEIKDALTGTKPVLVSQAKKFIKFLDEQSRDSSWVKSKPLKSLSKSLKDKVKFAPSHLAKQAISLDQRGYYVSKLERNPDAKHFTGYQGTDVEGFIFPPSPSSNYYQAAGFYGKQSKPAFNYLFKSFEAAEKELDNLAAQRKRWMEMKRKQMQERKDYMHDYVVGDILYSSWGYDQTNVNFYQVIAVQGKQVTLREVGSRSARSDAAYGADYVVATPDRFVGPAMKKLVQQGGVVRINSSQSAYKWDGKPKYETASGWGH